eukprot:gnl/TRDRNA2_/TRDRNA2_178863_c0_seq1.p1 gnl/TRDRNA2_/TRDRNA2_178863_c0~~gnl/TRDRNA2_/TRDRNA2_178863_c0_seq1.p1  ORF type:complete len:148 (-),score=29.00 gnl/TRDRNA2_/TRDRNA2_178863_c0_seq1:174-617(-)
MLSGKTARSLLCVEASVLVVFCGWMPFVFEAMPSEAEMAEFEADLLEQQSPKTCALTIGPAGQEPVVAWNKSSEEQATVSSECTIETAQTLDAKGLVEMAADDIEPKAQKKELCTFQPSRLSLLTFLISFIGGGVVSLDAFTAFPML